MHAGIVAATVYNVNRGKKARAKRPEDFIPTWDPHAERAEQTPDDHLRLVQQINAAMGGKRQGR